MSIKVSIESTGTGTDALSGKEGVEGLTVSFENEQPCFLSFKSFLQLVNLKAAQKRPAKVPTAGPEPKPATALPANGAGVVVK